MKKLILSAIVLLAFLSGYALAETGGDLIGRYLKKSQQKEMGLTKLNSTQRKKLGLWIDKQMRLLYYCINKIEFFERSHKYLKNNNWEEVEFKGTRKMKLDLDFEKKEYYIFKGRLWTYILEPRIYILNELKKGKYLGKMSYTSCEIIVDGGKAEKFWTKKTE